MHIQGRGGRLEMVVNVVSVVQRTMTEVKRVDMNLEAKKYTSGTGGAISTADLSFLQRINPDVGFVTDFVKMTVI